VLKILELWRSRQSTWIEALPKYDEDLE